jgi:hypothetical protein
MATTQLTPAFDDFLEYLVEKATPQQILAFQVSEAAQQRAEELTARNKAGTLTPEETDELNQMMEFNLLVSALKAKALTALKQS